MAGGTATPGAATWHYVPPARKTKSAVTGRATPTIPAGLEGVDAIDLGSYSRTFVSNIAPPVGRGLSPPGTAATGRAHATKAKSGPDRGRLYFDMGLRFLFSYQHELACRQFLMCLKESPDCALAHGLVALCHAPNYNFKGEAYYDSTDHPEQMFLDEIIVNHGNSSNSGVASLDGHMTTSGTGAGSSVSMEGEGEDTESGEEAREGYEGANSAHAAAVTALDDMAHIFPSQQVATKHARAAVEKVEELMRRARGRKRRASSSGPTGRGQEEADGCQDGSDIGIVDEASMERSLESSVVMEDAESGGSNSDLVHIVVDNSDCDTATGDPATAAAQPLSALESSQLLSQVEVDILNAIMILCAHPGVAPERSMDIVSRPYANAMRQVYRKHTNDAEAIYFFAESLMVLHAWSLYEYPTGRPLTDDVFEIREVLERGLGLHPDHAGLCHLFVHLSEMSNNPGKALPACMPLRTQFPDAGHLVHMATHIDVLVGDYESCVRWNARAIESDNKAMQLFPETSGTSSFYFGYIVHNFHMLVYGCVLGGFEQKAMRIANELNTYLHEDLFLQNPDLAIYLESYAALDVHILVRFGRWKDILQIPPPRHPKLMLYRSASLRYARALAFANLGNIEAAKVESRAFDVHRTDPEARNRILHNNSVAALLAVDAPMIRGEIAYHEGRHEASFILLRRAVDLQDQLHYDEPWGKMQPIRHALGGLLLEQKRVEEAEEVFRTDLKFHPRNPWGLRGLIDCLEYKLRKLRGDGYERSCCASEQAKLSDNGTKIVTERNELEIVFQEQRKSELADFVINKACACCKHR